LFKTFLYVYKRKQRGVTEGVEVLGLDHIDELDDDFKIQDVNKLF